MPQNDWQQKGVIYRETQDEKAKRRGQGLLGFISELDWLLSLELEEGKPLDETKITTGQKVYIFEIGFLNGLGIHGLVLFGLSLAFILFLYGTPNAPDWLPYVGWGVVLLIALLIKVLIPWWFLNTYYLYPRGVVYTYLLWFLWGFSLGLFVADFIGLIVSLGIKVILFLFEGTELYQKVFPYIQKYAPQFTSWWWLPVELLMPLLAFAGPFLLWLYKKKKPLGRYPWLPLDFIPDDRNEKELEELLKKYQ